MHAGKWFPMLNIEDVLCHILLMKEIEMNEYRQIFERRYNIEKYHMYRCLNINMVLKNTVPKFEYRYGIEKNIKMFLSAYLNENSKN